MKPSSSFLSGHLAPGRMAAGPCGGGRARQHAGRDLPPATRPRRHSACSSMFSSSSPVSPKLHAQRRTEYTSRHRQALMRRQSR